MTTALAHRGPDGDGFFQDPEQAVFLGHRRLSIIDIVGGGQPFFNEDGRVAVIFNGEIYNHLDLRAELKARGHIFKSDHSDTEVLVHGYEEWGDELPKRLNGMFAFVVYDAVRKRLFLARDRFGEKPLYY
ncbi:MAG TPA: asparagine synthetase B, partial [Dongiaceae bacterium]